MKNKTLLKVICTAAAVLFCFAFPICADDRVNILSGVDLAIGQTYASGVDYLLSDGRLEIDDSSPYGYAGVDIDVSMLTAFTYKGQFTYEHEYRDETQETASYTCLNIAFLGQKDHVDSANNYIAVKNDFRDNKVYIIVLDGLQNWLPLFEEKHLLEGLCVSYTFEPGQTYSYELNYDVATKKITYFINGKRTIIATLNPEMNVNDMSEMFPMLGFGAATIKTAVSGIEILASAKEEAAFLEARKPPEPVESNPPPVSSTDESGDGEEQKPEESKTGNLLWIVLGVAGGVLLIGGGAVALLVLKRKKRGDTI